MNLNFTRVNNETIEATCKVCGQSELVDFTDSEIARWKAGEFIQNVIPFVSSYKRELMISGTCGKCIDIMFGKTIIAGNEIKLPSRYIARNGDSFILISKDSNGNFIGAKDFCIFDKDTLNAIEPKDENLDLIEWDIKERKENAQ